MESINYLKYDWERGTGAQDRALKNKTETNRCLAFHLNKHGRGWTCAEECDLPGMIKKNRGLYEVLSSYPKKVYFDIDFHDPNEDFDEEEYLGKVIKFIQSYFPDIEFVVSGSVTSKKASFHLVSTNYKIECEYQLNMMKIYARSMWNTYEEIDVGVYSKNRQMKLPNQSKPDKPVQAIIRGDDIRDHFITSFFGDKEWRTIPEMENLPEELKEETDLSTNSNLKFSEIVEMNLTPPDDFDWDEVLTDCEKLLSLIPNGNQFDHIHTFRVCNFCVSNDVPKALFLKWLTRKTVRCEARVKKYSTLEWDLMIKRLRENPTYKVSAYRMRSMLPNWYPEIKPSEMHLKKFAKNWRPENLEMIERIEPDHYTVDKKFLLFSNPMGKGKTEMTIKYLNESCDSFLWIAPRITLCDDTHNRMTEAGLTSTHYGRLGNAAKTIEALKYAIKSPNPTICLNSLPKLRDRDDFPEVIVIDEIETILTGLATAKKDFLKDKTAIIDVLKMFCIHAKKVILLDAFITRRTQNFFRELCGTTIEDEIVYDTVRDETEKKRVVHEYDKEFKMENVIMDMVAKLCRGEKILCFYPFKKSNNSVKGMDVILAEMRLEAKMRGYEGDPTEDFICYNADSSDIKKKTIANVNQNWKDKKFVMFNNIITAGVSYTNRDSVFTSCYLFAVGFIQPRDLAQASYRARQLTSGDIYLKHCPGMQNQAWDKDTHDVKRTSYTTLHHDTMIELQAPYRESLAMFFKRANYDVGEMVKTCAIERFTGVCEDLYFWGAIPDISENAFNNIVEDTLEGNLTTKQILSARKYIFRHHFVEDTPEHVLALTWTNGDEQGIIHTIKAMNDDNSFESHMSRENGWDIFPTFRETTKWDVKMSDDAKKALFDTMEFKYHTDKTTREKSLIMTAFNTKYRTEVIKYRKSTKTYEGTGSANHLKEYAKYYKAHEPRTTCLTKPLPEDKVVRRPKPVESTRPIPVVKKVDEEHQKWLAVHGIQRFFVPH